jgi:hypothetical protein
LALRARVSPSTIRSFEAGVRVPHANNLTAIRRVLEEAGIVFGDGDTVGRARPKKPRPKKD